MPPAAYIVSVQQPVAYQTVEAESTVLFPSTTNVLAAGFVTAEEEKVLTEEEMTARDEARRTAAIVVFFGAAPSFFAQDQLIWRKERLNSKLDAIEGKKKKKKGR